MLYVKNALTEEELPSELIEFKGDNVVSYRGIPYHIKEEDTAWVLKFRAGNKIFKSHIEANNYLNKLFMKTGIISPNKMMFFTWIIDCLKYGYICDDAFDIAMYDPPKKLQKKNKENA